MAGNAGKLGTVTINSEVYRVRQWSIDSNVDLLPDTSSGDVGEETYVAGISRIIGTMEMNFDHAAAGSNFDSIHPGTTIATGSFVTNGSTQLIAVDSLIIERVVVTCEIEGMVTITVDWKGNGTTLATALAAMEP